MSSFFSSVRYENLMQSLQQIKQQALNGDSNERQNKASESVLASSRLSTGSLFDNRDTAMSDSSFAHSLKASTTCSSFECEEEDAITVNRDNDGKAKSFYDSGVETATHHSNATSVSLDMNADEYEDMMHEKRCIADAKQLMTMCISNSARLNRYKLSQLLGYGTFGIVLEGREWATGQSVAIKIMRKSQIHQNRVCQDPETLESSTLEVVLLKYVPRHENIIQFIDSWSDEECVYMVTELGGYAWNFEQIDPVSRGPAILSGKGCGSLLRPAKSTQESEMLTISVPKHGLVQQIKIPQSPNDRSSAGLLRAFGAFSKTPSYRPYGTPVVPEHIQKRIFRQLVKCVLTLHQNGVTHKDLKDENVLLDANLNLRLIDFGHAALYRSESGDQVASFKAYGTPVFSPPEVRAGLHFHGPEADVYAMGLMMYEYHFGDVPDNFDEAAYVLNGPCIFDISASTGFSDPQAIDLVRWMLQPDPRNRATIYEVLAHPYLN